MTFSTVYIIQIAVEFCYVFIASFRIQSINILRDQIAFLLQICAIFS